jgi:hydroxymethylbilane synthase
VAALERLGLSGEIAQVLHTDLVLPQVAQGALAVECRDDDEQTLALLAAIDDTAAHAAVDAERAFLRCLGGGCDLPCGALARAGAGGGVTVEVLLATHDGKTVLRASHQGQDPDETGSEAARILLEDLGGQALLDARATD